MPTNTQQICSSISENEAVLRWSIHLARKYPVKLACIISLIALVSAAAYFAVGLALSVGAVLVLLGSLADFLFPVTYVLTTDGAACNMLFKSSRIRWERVKHCYVDAKGIKLSPLDRISKLEAFRGVYLRFNRNDEQVAEVVKSLWREQCSE